MLVGVIKELPFATNGGRESVIYVVVDRIVDFFTEGQEKVVPTFFDAEVGVV